MNPSVNESRGESMSKIPLAVDHAIKSSQSLFESMEKPMEDAYSKMKTKTIDAYDSSIQVVKYNPIRSLAIALGVGALAGYLLKRR
jgi:ElaB/YqjD/DUF883 family membrane-anchored ribosome-binding protein